MNTTKYFWTIANDIIANPDDWKYDRFYAKHKSGLDIWIANGPTFFRTDAKDPGMAIFWIFVPWRVKLWYAMRQHIKEAKKEIARLKDEAEKESLAVLKSYNDAS